MPEYIDREALLAGLTAAAHRGGATQIVAEAMMRYVKLQPAADVAPVVHGRWVYKHRHRGGIRTYEGKDEMGETRRISVDERHEIDDPYCSECGKLNESDWLNYCPNCGAKMDGEPCTTP